jgi:hypothetical protein
MTLDGQGRYVGTVGGTTLSEGQMAARRELELDDDRRAELVRHRDYDPRPYV